MTFWDQHNQGGKDGNGGERACEGGRWHFVSYLSYFCFCDLDWLQFASFVCLFRLEMRSWALRWCGRPVRARWGITLLICSCLRFTWITLNYQPVMSSECQYGQVGGSDIENISCLGFAWCLYRDVLWMPVFENYWGNGFDCCSMEKIVWKAFVEPHLMVQAKVDGRLLKRDLLWPSLIFFDLLIHTWWSRLK